MCDCGVVANGLDVRRPSGENVDESGADGDDDLVDVVDSEERRRRSSSVLMETRWRV